MRMKRELNQFFTPTAVAQMMVALVDERSGLAMDPACGDGVFLDTLRKAGFEHIVGVDIDAEAITVCRRRLGSRVILACRDGLDGEGKQDGKCSLVIGNPPFSNQKLLVSTPEVLTNFELARRKGMPTLFGEATVRQPPEALFLEKFIRLAKPNGHIVIILPDNVVANQNLQYARDFIIRKTFVRSVISLPRGIFQGTTAKTVVLHLQKKPNEATTQETLVNLLVVKEPYELATIASKVHAAIEDKQFVRRPLADVAAKMLPEYYLGEASSLVERLAASGYPIMQLGDLCRVRTGFACYEDRRKFATSADSNGLVKFISAKVITPYGVDFARDRKFIKRDSPMFRLDAMVRDGEVLVVRVGAGCAGRVGIAYQDDDCLADDWIHIITADAINPFYLAAYLASPIGQAFIDREKHGVGTVSFSKSALRSIPIVVPDEGFQADIERLYKSLLTDFKTHHPRFKLQQQFTDIIQRIQLKCLAD